MKTLSSPHVTADAWPQPLISVLERQQQLVEQLAALAETQASLIAERRTERLLELLGRRQTIIDEFTVCQSEMGALSQDLDHRLSQTGEPQRERIRTLIGAIGNRLRHVMERDQQDEAALHHGRNAVLAEMTEVKAGSAARNAYQGRPTGVVNRFADQQG